MRFLDETGARTEIARLTAVSQRRDFAVAFWGKGATERLGLAAQPQSATVICNLAMGGTNPSEIRVLRRAGVGVRQSDELHAKVYLFDEAVVLGSSNASSNGLSFQESDDLGWREANVLIENPATVRSVEAWLAALPSREITEADLQAAETIWKRRRRDSSPPPPFRSILNTLKTRPDYFADRGGWLLLYMDEIDEDAKLAVAAIQRTEGKNIAAYQDFAGLPDEGQILNFWVGERGGVTFDDYSERTCQLTDRKIGNKMLQFCLPRSDVLGLRYFSIEKGEWTKIVKRIVGSEFWHAESRCAAVPLGAVASFIPFEQPKRVHATKK